ncbi:olfactory receptor 5-like [Octodon degus]|uniref:Olfactory receptor 5-like n=1 Tax=Octodon degus TaxID=10160 RepID=A0A6P3FM38_OCTDE|nr:olfactory receptor 5-like [Octodon degus]
MARSLEVANRSSNQDFILLGLSASPGVRDALFATFLALYLLILLENTLIIYLTCGRRELRKPMYFFLGNLSGLELCYVSVTMPTLLAGLRSGACRVSFPACTAQLFLFLALMGTKSTLLASMAYDRYVAICRPLHYALRMRPPVCRGLAAGSWLGGLGAAALLRLPSASAARRALAACASHLAVMGVFYAAALSVDSRPGPGHPADLSKALSLLYTVLTPACSPVVYCLRNREVHAALRRALGRLAGSREN